MRGLCFSDEETLARAEELGCASVVTLVQAIAAQSWRDPPPVWLVTAGAVATGRGAEALVPAQAPLWGMARVLRHEHPELACHVVDLDHREPEGHPDAVLAELHDDDGEDQVAVRGGRRWVARCWRCGCARATGSRPARCWR